jgi:RNA:NAD 2'-phosphotransferase (TPT1/KptA family)
MVRGALMAQHGHMPPAATAQVCVMQTISGPIQTRRLTDGSSHIPTGRTLLSGGLLCRYAGGAFVWTPKNPNPHYGKLSRKAQRKIQHVLRRAPDMQKLATVDNVPVMHPASVPMAAAALKAERSLLDSGASNHCRYPYPGHKILDHTPVEGVDGHTGWNPRTVEDELIISSGPELISMGRMVLRGGQSFIWLPFANSPHFGPLPLQAAEKISQILSECQTTRPLEVRNYIPLMTPDEAAQEFSKMASVNVMRTDWEAQQKPDQPTTNWDLDRYTSKREVMDRLQAEILQPPTDVAATSWHRALFDNDNPAMTELHDHIHTRGGLHKLKQILETVAADIKTLQQSFDPILTVWSTDDEYATERMWISFSCQPESTRNAVYDRLRQLAHALEPNPDRRANSYSINSLPMHLRLWLHKYADVSLVNVTHVVEAWATRQLEDGKGVYLLNGRDQIHRPETQINSSGQWRTTFIVPPDDGPPLLEFCDVVPPRANREHDVRLGPATTGCHTITVLTASNSYVKTPTANVMRSLPHRFVSPELPYRVVQVLRHRFCGQDESGAVTLADLIDALPEDADELRDPRALRVLPRLSRDRLEVFANNTKIRARYGHSDTVPTNDDLLFHQLKAGPPGLAGLPDYIVHETDARNAASINEVGLHTGHTNRTHLFFRTVETIQDAAKYALNANSSDVRHYFINVRDALRAGIRLQVPKGENKRGLCVTRDPIPPALLVSKPPATVLARCATAQPTDSVTADPAVEHTREVQLYEALDIATEILMSDITDIQHQRKVAEDKPVPAVAEAKAIMTRGMKRRAEEADPKPVQPQPPDIPDEPTETAEQPQQSDAPKTCERGHLQDEPDVCIPVADNKNAVDDDVHRHARQEGHPHALHFPHRSDCAICCENSMYKQHRRRQGGLRIGTWSLDMAEGPDKTFVLVLANSSVETGDPPTYHVSVPTDLKADAIQLAVIRALLEIEYFFNCSIVRRVHADKAPVFTRMREVLAVRFFCTLTTTQGYDSSSNGYAERAIRTLKRTAERSLAQSGLDDSAWALAMQHAAFAYSREKRLELPDHTDPGSSSWMRAEVKRLQQFGAECLAGRGPKASGPSGRRAVYLMPSSKVPGGALVGIIDPVLESGAKPLTGAALQDYSGEFNLRYLDDVSHFRPRLCKGEHMFPTVRLDDDHDPPHAEDLTKAWIQCSKCRKFRSIERENLAAARQHPDGYSCDRHDEIGLDKTSCDDPQDPAFRTDGVNRVGPVNESVLQEPKRGRGRPKGSTNKVKKSTDVNNKTFVDRAPKKLGRNRIAKPAARSRTVAAAILCCSTAFIADRPPEDITTALHAAIATTSETNPTSASDADPATVPTIDLNAAIAGSEAENTDGAWLATDCDDRPLPEARVYKELGVAAAPSVEGGAKAIAKELMKYLGSRSLGRPVRRDSLSNTAVIFKAKLLFGLKEAETATPSAKARLVIGGHIGFSPSGRVVIRHSRDAETRSGADYWTPGASLAAVRYCVSYAAVKGFVISSRDLSTAYLQSITNEKDSYVQLPLSPEITAHFPPQIKSDLDELRFQGVEDRDVLFPVVASLYGLPSAGFSYWKAVEAHLCENGWCQLQASGGALWMRDENLLCTYVDDFLLCALREDVEEIWRRYVLKKRWMADYQPLAPLTRYLGLYIHAQDDNSYCIEQNTYAESIATTYTTLTGNKIRTRSTLPPPTGNDEPSKLPADATGHAADIMDMPDHYRVHAHAVLAQGLAVQGKDSTPDPIHSTIGALMYVSRGSRPDVAFAVQKLAERVHEWQPEDSRYLEAVLGYLLHQQKGLVYGPLPPGATAADVRAVSYADSNYVAPVSRSGMVYSLQLRGHADFPFFHLLDWASVKQRYAALSSSQAETVALCAAARRVIECGTLIANIYGEAHPTSAPYVFCDSSSALAAVRRGWSRALSAASRAVGVAVQWLSDESNAGNIQMQWLSGQNNPADSLTKRVTAQGCAIQPLMAVFHDDKVWRAPNHRNEGSKVIPRSTQPLWEQGVGPCFLCTRRSPLCFRCKLCAACGCDCPAELREEPENANSHPLIDNTTTQTEGVKTTTSANHVSISTARRLKSVGHGTPGDGQSLWQAFFTPAV